VLAAAVAVAVAGPARGGLCVAVMITAAGLTAVGAHRELGGCTGDTLGATVAVGELAVLLALLASWR
jgi:adenosylcobinamide-GDP ribazoletransferase